MTYNEWDDLLWGWLLRDDLVGQTLFVTIDDELLCRLSKDCFPTSGGSQAAGNDLAFEVRRSRWQVGRLGASSGRRPPIMPMIAVQVLAVSRMDDTEEWTANSYWPQLNKLLQLDPPNPHDRPEGLTREIHQDIWRGQLKRYVNQTEKGRYGRIVLPDEDVRMRHIALPFSQSLLRQKDRDGLAGWFAAVGLRPGERLGVEDFDELTRDAADGRFFSPHARRVLQRTSQNADRRRAALRQIQNTFVQWERKPLPSVGQRGGARQPAAGRSVGWIVPTARALRSRGAAAVTFGPDVRDTSIVSASMPYEWSYGNRLFVLDDACRVFVERIRGKLVRPGMDAALILSAESAKAAFDQARVLAEPGGVRVEFGAGSGLPGGRAVVFVRFRANVTAIDLAGAPIWKDYVRTGGPVLHVGGGTTLGGAGRRRWVRGMGPILRVEGMTTAFAGMLVVVRRLADDGSRLESFGVQADGTVACSAVWRMPGRYEVWLSIRPDERRSIRVVRGGHASHARMAWVRSDTPEAWPIATALADDAAPDAYMAGPVVDGEWPARKAPAETVNRSPLWDVLAARGSPLVRTQTSLAEKARSGHPLKVALATRARRAAAAPELELQQSFAGEGSA